MVPKKSSVIYHVVSCFISRGQFRDTPIAVADA